MKGRGASMKVKLGLRDSIVLSTLTLAAETWTLDESQRSSIQAVGKIYLRGSYGLTRWNKEMNKGFYKRFGMAGNKWKEL